KITSWVTASLLTALLGSSALSEPTPPATPPKSSKPEEAQTTVKGVVKKKVDSQLEIAREDGQGDVRVTLAETVLVTKEDRPAVVGDLRPGQRVQVTLKGKTLVAISINIIAGQEKAL